ncbi:MAG: D-sedoheptulose 7-phosphate isomerase [Acidobacteriota bacterium]
MRLNDDCARNMIRKHLLRSAEVKQSLAEQCAAQIAEAASLIADSLKRGGKMLLCGNGGSAADCQHIATEFTSILSKDFLRPAMAAIALTTDTSFLTASANDFGFETIFARQVEALGRPRDVLVGISTSGNSSNVINAVSRARELGLHTLVLTGGTGGHLAYLADVSIKVPSDSTSHIQESHIAIGHVICAVVEQMLFGDHRQDGANADSARELAALGQD